MSTYLELQQRVANDHLNRTDFPNEVKRAIKATIRFYERQRWRFNETASALLSSAGQSYLTIPSNFLTHDYLQITYGGIPTKLQETDLSSILTIRAGASNGPPTHYTLYGNKIELAVKPDSAYSCPLYYLKSLPELNADADTNSWTTGVFEDLIAYGSAKYMWANVLRNEGEAANCATMELNALQIAEQEIAKYNSSKLRSTEF